MPTYISHITWTEQGIRSVKDSPKRLDAVKKQLKTLGGELKAFYMTQGTYDALLIFEVRSGEVAPSGRLCRECPHHHGQGLRRGGVSGDHGWALLRGSTEGHS